MPIRTWSVTTKLYIIQDSYKLSACRKVISIIICSDVQYFIWWNEFGLLLLQELGNSRQSYTLERYLRGFARYRWLLQMIGSTVRNILIFTWSSRVVRLRNIVVKITLVLVGCTMILWLQKASRIHSFIPWKVIDP